MASKTWLYIAILLSVLLGTAVIWKNRAIIFSHGPILHNKETISWTGRNGKVRQMTIERAVE